MIKAFTPGRAMGAMTLFKKLPDWELLHQTGEDDEDLDEGDGRRPCTRSDWSHQVPTPYLLLNLST